MDSKKTVKKRADASKAAPARGRIRRSPDEARELILKACTRVLAEHGPHAVGLKDVAREAGVSHSLVNHYFGSIDKLIDTALETRAEQNRRELSERILSRADEGPRVWLEQWFRFVNDSDAGRLLAWSFLTGRIGRDDFFSRRTRGAAKMVDVLSERFKDDSGQVPFQREDLEFLLLLVSSASFGYAIGREGFWSSLGVDRPGAEQDRFFLDRLTQLVEGATATTLEAAAKKPAQAKRKAK